MESEKGNKDGNTTQLRQDQEDNQQIIYECKKKIETFLVLEKEYLEEIERLNQDKSSLSDKLELRNQHFEEEKNNLIKNFNEEIRILQNELLETERSKEELIREFENMKQRQHNISNCIPEETKRISISDLEYEIMELKDIIDNLNTQLKIYQKQCMDLEEQQQLLKMENENLKEILNIKKNELTEANAWIQDLNDNISCLRHELDNLKHKPLDEQSQGNSLFAEVNDSRLELMKKLKTVMARYTKMAREREGHLKEIEHLRSEKTRLIELFEVDIKQYKPGNQREIDAYESTIKGLDEVVENLKKELSEVKMQDYSSSVTNKDLKYFETHLKRKDKEIETLRDSLKIHSTSHTIQARKLSQLGTEMVNWKWKASEFENKIRILENKMKEMEEKCNIETISGDSKVNVEKKEKEKKVVDDDKCETNILKPIEMNNRWKLPEHNTEKTLSLGENCDETKSIDDNSLKLLNEKKTTNTVRFKENIEEKECEKSNVKRKGKVVVKPLSISHYSKTELK